MKPVSMTDTELKAYVIENAYWEPLYYTDSPATPEDANYGFFADCSNFIGSAEARPKDDGNILVTVLDAQREKLGEFTITGVPFEEIELFHLIDDYAPSMVPFDYELIARYLGVQRKAD